MSGNVGVLRERMAELNAATDRVIDAILDQALELEAGDRAGAEELFETAKLIGESE